MGAYDKNGPQLYALDPLGTCLRYFGSAVGKGRQVSCVVLFRGDKQHRDACRLLLLQAFEVNLHQLMKNVPVCF